jgi:nucleotide-binding universal stress UspA family protein
MFLNILVAVDGSDASLRALEQAADLARTQNSLLMLMTVAPPVPAYIMFAGRLPDAFREELDKWATRILAHGVATLPDDLPVHVKVHRGHAGRDIVKELERGSYDLLVLGSRWRGRAREGLFGSVNGYVHFHSPVPILSVSAPHPLPSSEIRTQAT